MTGATGAVFCSIHQEERRTGAQTSRRARRLVAPAHAPAHAPARRGPDYTDTLARILTEIHLGVDRLLLLTCTGEKDKGERDPCV